jgi:predicted DNA-binding transcriptional regulator AlpA
MLDEEYWTLAQVSTRFKIGKPTLYRWSSEGVGPIPLRIGGRLRYPRSEIERWVKELDEHQREPAR